MAAPRAKKKVVSKDDLRRLMREKQSSSKTSTKKIDSPYAKYNSLGQLVCAVCNTQIKNELLWNAHIQGRTHKETVSAFKAANEQRALAGPPVPSGVRKRKGTPGDPTVDKVMKVQQHSSNKDVGKSKGLPSDFFDDKAKGKEAHLKLGHYSSSDDEAEAEEVSARPIPPPNASGGLPSDFFDAGFIPSASKVVSEEEKPQTMADKLPEGFFDDPKQDAKVRQVEYRDKMEDEWDFFQKVMKEETHKSEAIQAEDDEANITERNIDEIDDQMHRWSKVSTLAKKKEEIMSTEGDKNKRSESDESDFDEQEFDEFLDWRTKKAWK